MKRDYKTLFWVLASLLAAFCACASPPPLYVGSFTGNGGGLTNHVFYYDAKKDFGATGNGVTDDTAALQSAISALTNTGGRTTLFLPTGQYKIRSSLVFTSIVNGGYTIKGAGWYSTSVVCDMTNKVAFDASAASGTSVLEMRDIGFKGPLVDNWVTTNTVQAIAVGGTNIGADYGDHWQFENLRFAGFYRAMTVSNQWATSFSHLRFDSNYLSCMEVTDIHYFTMRQCDFNGVMTTPGRAVGNGLVVWPGGGVEGLLEGCQFNLCTNGVFQADDSITYVSCQWQNCGAALHLLGLGTPPSVGLASFYGCGFSDLFSQAPDFSLTNNNPAIIVADGTLARSIFLHQPAFESDGTTPTRGTFWTYPTNISNFNWNGTNSWMPNVMGASSDSMTWYWGGRPGNLSGLVTLSVYNNSLTSPTFGPSVLVTNSPDLTATTGQQHGMSIVDGNSDGALRVGGNTDRGFNTQHAGWISNKLAVIMAPNSYDGSYNTAMITYLESTANSGLGGVVGIGGGPANVNAPFYINFYTKNGALPPNAGSLRWQINDTGGFVPGTDKTYDVGYDDGTFRFRPNDVKVGGTVISQGGYWLRTNTTVFPPAVAESMGSAYFWNSNGTIRLLTTLPNSTAWAKTNQLAP